VQRRLVWFRAIAVAGTLVVIAVLAIVAQRYLSSEAPGKHVNYEAWKATFHERGLPVPPGGPRDGIWQEKLPKRDLDPELGWAESAYEDPGKISIDERGWQYYPSRHEARYQLLIVGGSVALGAYASDQETVYFTRLGRRLDEDPRTASDIVVVASLAWKSSQELAALARRTGSVAADWVIAIDGLNDVTNGSNALSLYQQKTETLDGSPWTVEYHEHDYIERAVEYSNNVQKMLRVAHDRDARLLVVLQPALFERSRMTEIEADLWRRVRDRFGTKGHLNETYTAMRRGLALIAEQTDLEVLDASRLFDDEPETTFTDLWHFTDPAHALLADAIAARLIPLLLAEGGTGD
jgi:lysophospholipase L1-like esterase